MSLNKGKAGLIFCGLVATVIVVTLAGWAPFRSASQVPWTEAEVEILRSLWIGNLPSLPADPTNSVADDPRAAHLGHQLFFDVRLSSNGSVSCSTCHQPQRRFTDGLLKGRGIGESKRNTPSIVAAGYSPWLYWDGRRDSLWSQALSPLEDPVEHGGDRRQYAQFIASSPLYRSQYESVFGAMPELSDPIAVDVVFSNLGKAIAAYERLLMPGPSRFDVYAAAVFAGDRDLQRATFSKDEVAGLRLFITTAKCLQCHNGPLLTNNEFHNTGVMALSGEVPDKGRVVGVREVRADPFNCLGRFSDAAEASCNELEFARSGPELLGTFRTPSLRNLEGSEPYMHKGQIETLAAVLQHYNDARPAMIGHNEAEPLGLSSRELRQLESFLDTLAAPIAVADKWLRPPSQ